MGIRLYVWPPDAAAELTAMARALVVVVGGAPPVVREQLELRARELLGDLADKAPDLVSAVLADAGLVEVGDLVEAGGGFGDSVDFARWQEVDCRNAIDLTVAPYGAEFSTIGAALAAARPGDRIIIGPGIYGEAPAIDIAVHLVGDGDRSEIVLEPSGGAFVMIGATGATIEGLTIRTGIDVYAGQPSIIDCDVTASPSHGVIIRDRAEPTIRGCAVHDNTTSGLFIHTGARGELSEDEIHGNGHHGIMVDGDAAPRVLQCRIHGNSHSGVYLSGHSTGVLTGNDIRNNGHCGVTAASQAAPQLQGNEIHRNGRCGVEQSGNGSGSYVRNDVHSNDHDGFRVLGPACPQIVGNTIASNAQFGVVVTGKSVAVVRGNRVRCNVWGGVKIERQGTFKGGDSTPMLPVAVLDNEVTENGGNGIIVCDGHGSICGNRITANAWVGVLLQGRLGLGYVRSNVIVGNAGSGVECDVSEGSGPVVEWNTIRANTKSGIDVQGTAGGCIPTQHCGSEFAARDPCSW